jgi:hypothetical protein
VEEVNYLDNGGLEVNVLHAGNRTIEVFPKDHWTHCTTKHLVNEEDAAQAEKAKLAIAHALQPKIFKPNITFSKSLVDSLADVKLSPEERSSWLEWVKVKLKPKVTK